MASIYESFSIQKVSTKGPLTLSICRSFVRTLKVMETLWTHVYLFVKVKIHSNVTTFGFQYNRISIHKRLTPCSHEFTTSGVSRND